MHINKNEYRIIWPILVMATLALFVMKSSYWPWCMAMFGIAFVLYFRSNYFGMLHNMHIFGVAITEQNEAGLEAFKYILTLSLIIFTFKPQYLSVPHSILLGLFAGDVLTMIVFTWVEKRFLKKLYAFLNDMNPGERMQLLFSSSLFIKSHNMEAGELAVTLLYHRKPLIELAVANPAVRAKTIAILANMQAFMEQSRDIENTTDETLRKEKIKKFQARWNYQHD